MNLFLTVFLVFTASGFCTACIKVNKRKPAKNAIPAGTQKHSEVKFSAGDIIACDMDTEVYPASHIFLALSHEAVIHVKGPPNDGGNETRIVEEDFSEAGSRYTACKKITDFYDEQYASFCGGSPLSTSEIVKRADASRIKFRGQVTYYNTYRCNCEHWVSAWRYGTSWTLQLPKNIFVHMDRYKSDQCEAPGKQSCS